MQDIRTDGKLDYMLDNIGFVNVLRNANYTFPYKNGKDRYSVIFVENGQIDYYFINDGTLVNLMKDSVLFIPKDTPYIATYSKDNTNAKIFIFDIVSDNIPQQFKSLIHKSSAALSEIFVTITRSNANSPVFLVAKAYELLFHIEKENDVIPERFKKIIPALNEIQKFYYKCEKLSFYSDLCKMSESNFRRLFREYAGKSFIEYRNQLRIAHAHKMITSGEYTVQEAAYLAGFNNMSFFYEVYNKNTKK